MDIYGKAWYAEYDQFTVGNVSDGYRLTVSGYHGNASDALNYQNHMQFSAIDSDRDVSNTHCAANYEGGWSVFKSVKSIIFKFSFFSETAFKPYHKLFTSVGNCKSITDSYIATLICFTLIIPFLNTHL